MSKELRYITSDSGVTVYVDGDSKIISCTSPLYVGVMEAIRNDDLDAVRTAVNVKETIVKSSNGNISLDDGTLMYKGDPLRHALKNRIVKMLNGGFDVSPLVNFLDNLMENPSFRSVNETYGFLEACNLPITPDGCFIGYKMIRNDYTDIYTGTMDNSVGKTVSVNRNEVDEDSENTCSFGLHVCSQAYLGHYGRSGDTDRVVAVKVNPRDVVAVPADYDNSKMRVSSYDVVDELGWDTKLPTGFTDAYDEIVTDSDDLVEDVVDDVCDDDSDLDVLNDVGATLPTTLNQPLSNSTNLTGQDVIDIRQWLAEGKTLNGSETSYAFGTLRCRWWEPRALGELTWEGVRVVCAQSLRFPSRGASWAACQFFAVSRPSPRK